MSGSAFIASSSGATCASSPCRLSARMHEYRCMATTRIKLLPREQNLQCCAVGPAPRQTLLQSSMVVRPGMGIIAASKRM